MMNITFDWDEVDSLITLLQAKGISYLIGVGSSESQNGRNDDSVHLIQRLAACGYPLVENASISLFILHPELAPSVVEALQRSEGEIAENIAVVILATLYLQQWWFFRLAFALGRLPCFPEVPFVSLWEERHLPPLLRAMGCRDFSHYKSINGSDMAFPSTFSTIGRIRSIICLPRRKPIVVSYRVPCGKHWYN